MSNKALIVIDAQVNMFAKDFCVYQGEQILQTLGAMIEAARKTDTAVIFVRNNGDVGDPDEAHTLGWEIHPSLHPDSNDIILDKHTPDTFASTELQKLLDERAIQSLIIAGMQTEMCVQATTECAINLGYQVTLVADGHTTFDFPDDPPAADIIAQFNEAMQNKAQVKMASKIAF